MADDMAVDVDRDLAHARHTAGGTHQLLAQGRNQAFGGVAQLDFERHVGADDFQIAQGLAGDEILLGVGVYHSGQGLEQT